MNVTVVVLVVVVWVFTGVFVTAFGVSELREAWFLRAWKGSERVLGWMVLTGLVGAPVWLLAGVLYAVWHGAAVLLGTVGVALDAVRGGR